MLRPRALLLAVLVGTALGSFGSARAATGDEPADPELVLVPPSARTPLTPAWPDEVPAAWDAAPVNVTFEVELDASGAVVAVRSDAAEDVVAFAAKGEALLRAAAFEPATEGGQPIGVIVPITLTFDPPPINVEGVVSDPAGVPVAGVTVHAAGRSTVSRDGGAFAFRGVPSGALRVEATIDGLPVAVDAVLGAGERLVLRVQPALPDPGIVGVYAREREQVLRRSLSAAEIRVTPGTMGDPLRAVSNLPGVSRTPLDSGWILVRGGDPRETGVYVDGVRLRMVYHLGGFTSVIHPELVDEVRFLPGGGSVRYGRATAGTVDVITRAPEGPVARAGANLVFAGAYLAIPTKDAGTFSFAGRRSYLDAVLGLVPGITADQAAIAPRFGDWMARWDRGGASILAIGTSDLLDVSSSAGDAAQVGMQTQRLHGRFEAVIGGRTLRVQPWVGWQLDRLSIQRLGRQQLAQTVSGGARVEVVDDEQGVIGWSAGVDGAYDWFGMRLGGVERYASMTSPDVYADVRVGRRARVVAGARLDTLFVRDQLPRVAVSPRLSGRVPVVPGVSVSAEAAWRHMPPPSDLLVGAPEGSALDLEEDLGGAVGVTWEDARWMVAVEAYNRRRFRLTAYEADGSLGQGQGAAYGLEAQARGRIGRSMLMASVGWGRALRRESEDGDWSRANWESPLSVTLIGAYEPGKAWTLSGRWRFASGYPVGWDVEAYDPLNATTSPVIRQEGGRTSPFHALDLKVSKTIVVRRFNLDVYLDVQNVYNRREAEPVITGIWEAYGIQTWSYGLPVLPIFGIEGSYRPLR